MPSPNFECLDSPRIVIAVLVMSACALSACTTAPTAAPQSVVAVVPSAPAQAWWLDWQDPVLDGLQTRLLVQSPGLQASMARVRQAQAALRSAQAGLSPTVGVQAGAQRAGSNSVSGPANAFSLSLPVSWELDVWGRLAERVGVADANLLASQADLAMARLSAQATLVQLYVQVRASERQLQVLNDTEAGQLKALQLTQVREAAGVASQQDVVQARLQWRNTQASRLDVESKQQALLSALAVLVGAEPSHFDWVQTGQLPAILPVPSVVQGDVLRGRPDVASAQATVIAAQAGVGVAQKAFFPTVSFSASAGFKSAELGSLLSLPAKAWALGGSLAATLFDGGARQAATEQAQASLDAAAANYRQVVLAALQELQNNLVLIVNVQQQLQAHEDALEAARRNLAMTQAQHQAGTVSYLNVILAQNSALSAELAVVNDRSQLLQANNLLLKNTQGILSPPKARKPVPVRP
jgi:NodT family efflux transporter outer membrane factor (OMF) lipoprotein